jgi:tripartite-type tricarboxylate transporter receptor subunit TctC
MQQENTMSCKAARTTCGSIAASVTLAFSIWLNAGAAVAQDYPSRPIKIIAGFPPGGGVDLVSRLIGQGMSNGLRQPIVVENKPGAAGIIGAAQAAKSDPDGYTLLVTPGGHSLFGAVFQSVPFDTVASFSWISNIINVPFFIVVRADSKFQSLTALIAEAKIAPGKISFGSAGPGSTHHLGGELLATRTGGKFLHVPYRGDAPVINALLGGEIDFAFVTPTQVVNNVEAGKLRALATTAGARSPKLPNIPTVQEALALQGFDLQTWFALAGPDGLPRPIVDRLNAELRKALTIPEVSKGLEAIGELKPTTPEEMRDRVAGDLKMWIKIVDDAKIPKQ